MKKLIEEDVIIPEVKSKPLGIEERFELKLERKEHAIFQHHAKEHLKRLSWLEIQDSSGRAMYFIMNKIVKDFDPIFNAEAISIELDYPRVWALYRFTRIAQLAINEENEEQKVFQDIAAKLFPII